MTDESRLPDSLVDPECASANRDDAAAMVDYYDKRHRGAYTATAIERSTGRALLLSRRVRWVLQELNVSPTALLDAGCGKGRWLSLWANLFPQCRLHACDLSSVAIEHARERAPQAEFAVSTQDCIPFPSNHFDLALSVEVIEHIRDPNRFVAELYRVLKPKGLCVVTTPCANRFSLDWFCAHLKPGGRIRTRWGTRWYMEDPSHLRRVTSQALEDTFAGEGFARRKLYFWVHFFARLDTKYGLYFRDPGKRFSGLRRRLRFLASVFDALSNLEWALCRHWSNGGGVIGVFQKPAAVATGDHGD